jgi:hypothetical protein
MGFTPAPFPPLVRRGTREAVRRGTVDLFGTEPVLATFTGARYGWIRKGDEIVFCVMETVLADVAPALPASDEVTFISQYLGLRLHASPVAVLLFSQAGSPKR